MRDCPICHQKFTNRGLFVHVAKIHTDYQIVWAEGGNTMELKKVGAMNVNEQQKIAGESPDWTAREDSLLRKLWRITSGRNAGEKATAIYSTSVLYPRSQGAIQRRAVRLGLEPINDKDAAQLLRTKGMGVREIARTLKEPASNISRWTATSRDWTKEEDEALIEATRKGMGPNEIYQTNFIPGRTKGAISGRMTALSLSWKHNSSPITVNAKIGTWSHKEEEILRNHAPQLRESKRRSKVIRELIEQGFLRRSMNAIQHKFWEMEKKGKIPQMPVQTPLDYLENQHSQSIQEHRVEDAGADAVRRSLAELLSILDDLHRRGCGVEVWNKHLAKALSIIETVSEDIKDAKAKYQCWIRWQKDPEYKEFNEFRNKKFEANIETREREAESQILRNLIVDRELKQPT